MKTNLELKHVYKFFKSKSGGYTTALNDVSFSFRENIVYGIVGESGSGKSTLGRISSGLEYPSKGEVILMGSNINKMKEKDIFRKAQYIHQDPYGSLDQYQTVYEILERPLIYLLKMRGKTEIRSAIENMLLKCGLSSDFMYRTTQELSGGEKQRVLVARAFITDAKIIVADEPTTMIDFVHRKEILDLIAKLGKDGEKTIMFISHDIAITEKISNYIFVMYKGNIVESGITDLVVNKPIHPYTQLLMKVSPEKIMSTNSFGDKIKIPAKVGSEFYKTNKGCRYNSHCPFAFQKCYEEEPKLVGTEEHKASCFLSF